MNSLITYVPHGCYGDYEEYELVCSANIYWVPTPCHMTWERGKHNQNQHPASILQWIKIMLGAQHCRLCLRMILDIQFWTVDILVSAFVSFRPSHSLTVQFSSVQSLSRVRLFATAWLETRQASLSITNSRSLLRLMPIESVMPSSQLILCRPLLLLPPIPPSIRVFSNESTLRMRWPKYWSFSFSTSLTVLSTFLRVERSVFLKQNPDWPFKGLEG